MKPTPRFRVATTPSNYVKLEQRIDGCGKCGRDSRWQTVAYMYAIEGLAERITELLNASEVE